MRTRAYYRLLRARLRAWRLAREARRRRELIGAVGYVSPRWIQSHWYVSGRRRGED
jgi:hypothetical protein